MDDFGWTYAADIQPSVEAGFQSWESRLVEEDPDFLVAVAAEIETMKRYLNDPSWSAHSAATAFIALNDPRHLQEIYRPSNGTYGRAGLQAFLLSDLIHDMPSTHVRISELVEAVTALKDEELGLTGAQMREMTEWGKMIRLGRFWEIVTDCSRADWPSARSIFHAAYEACDAARTGSIARIPRGCQQVSEALEDARWDPEGTGEEWPGDLDPETARICSPDIRIPPAAYWLIRAGRLIYRTLVVEEGREYKSMHPVAEPTLWKKAALSRPRWNFWKERLRRFVGQAILEPRTRHLAQKALDRMAEIESDP